MNGRLPYIPAHYEVETAGKVSFHFSTQEANANRKFVKQTCLESMREIQEILDFVPTRQTHVCCYCHSEDAWRALRRSVSPAMAMAPYSASDCGLVIVHSPCLDPMNADESRMRRILSHEFTHLFVAERSGSTKMLGDANRNMRVSAWLNEGLAEVTGFHAIAAEGRLAMISEQFLNAENFDEFETLSRRLDDLDDVLRPKAFVHATGAVNVLCQQVSGLREVFDQIPRIEAFFDSRDCCCPARLAEYGV